MNWRIPISSAETVYGYFTKAAILAQAPVLLVIRLYWGWQFFETGKGKLGNLGGTADFFATLGIPFPLLNATFAGLTECIGGLLLLIGLGSRIISVPLIVTMVVAYLTAERAALESIFSEPEKFLTADPFLFLFAAVLILVFGPGALSLDFLLARRFVQAGTSPATTGIAAGGTQNPLPG